MTAYVEDMQDVDLFHDELTTAQAAELAGVRPDLIRQWKARGYLSPCSVDRQGRPRFLGIDVAKAEHRTRVKHQSRRAA